MSLPELEARTAQRVIVLGAILFFFWSVLVPAWRRSETDFPNYYTAAVLVRQGAPLRLIYDWTWFERGMNHAGIEDRIGSYTPQTPLTMLPLIPLSVFSPQTAKRIWITISLFLLGATVWLLARAASVPLELVAMLAFCGFFSLRANFLYGQYYVFLLFLLALTYYLFVRSQDVAAGCIAAAAFVLKLYAGPLLLYFAAVRRPRVSAAMLAATCAFCALAIALFGWPELRFYANHILLRSVEGGSVNPYDPGSSTVSALLYKLFRIETELNPHPFLDAPFLFFFLRTFCSLIVLSAVTWLVAFHKPLNPARAYALFVIALLLLSTSVGSYSYLLILLPVVLLWPVLLAGERIVLFALYVLLTAPIPYPSAFPKLWLLAGLLWFAGRGNWIALRRKAFPAILALACAVALFRARHELQTYQEEPARHFARVAPRQGAIFSGFPVATSSGLVFQTMLADRYALCRFRDGRTQVFQYQGQAVSPRRSVRTGMVAFDLLSRGTDRHMEFDPANGETRVAPAETPLPSRSALSPDGRWVAYAKDEADLERIWLRYVATGREWQLTGGNCNSSSPSWEADSSAIVFASDCDRAVGLPALYRAALPLP